MSSVVVSLVLDLLGRVHFWNFQVHSCVSHDTIHIYTNLGRFSDELLYFVTAMISLRIPMKPCPGCIMGHHHSEPVTTQVSNHRFRNLFCRVVIISYDYSKQSPNVI